MFTATVDEAVGFVRSQILSVTINFVEANLERSRHRRALIATFTFTFVDSVGLDVAINAAAALQN
jgi:hypothetical protein